MAWIGPVVQGVTGLAQTIAASAAAKNLPDAQKYEATPQMKRAEAMAERRAEQGMSSAERGAFEQGMARRTGAAERAMRNIGMSGIAQGVSNIFNIDAQNQFSAQSEAERRKGEAMYAGIAGQMQGIQDRETSSFNQMLQQQRTALGGAAASGMKNITGAFGMAAQAANTNKLAEAYANSGDTINYNLGTGTTGATTPATPPASFGQFQAPQINQPFEGYGMDMFNSPQAPPITPQLNQPFQGYGTDMFQQQFNQPQEPFATPQINQPFQGYGTDMFGQPVQGPQLNQPFQGYGMGVYG